MNALDDFEEEFARANKKNGAGHKTNMWLDELPEDYKDIAIEALGNHKYTVHVIERVFQRWAKELNVQAPIPGRSSLVSYIKANELRT